MGNPGAGSVLGSKWAGSQTLVGMLQGSRSTSCGPSKSGAHLAGAQKAGGNAGSRDTE